MVEIEALNKNNIINKEILNQKYLVIQNKNDSTQKLEVIEEVLKGIKNGINGQKNITKNIDLNCVNQCINKGNLLPYCNSFCSY